jgi:hypothetical protein
VYDPATMTSVAYPLAEHWDGIYWTQVPAAAPQIPGQGPSPIAECGCGGRWLNISSATSVRSRLLLVPCRIRLHCGSPGGRE